MNTNTLRVLIVGQWIVLVATVVAGLMEEKYLPDMLIFYLAEKETAGLATSEIVFSFLLLIFLLLYLTASAGLFYLKKWGRGLYLNTNICMLILVPFFGPQIMTPISYALDSLISLLVGLTIGVVYFSDLKEVFEVKSTP